MSFVQITTAFDILVFVGIVVRPGCFSSPIFVLYLIEVLRLCLAMKLRMALLAVLDFTNIGLSY